MKKRETDQLLGKNAKPCKKREAFLFWLAGAKVQGLQVVACQGARVTSASPKGAKVASANPRGARVASVMSWIQCKL